MVVGYSSSYTSPGLVSMQNNATTSFEVTKEIVSEANTKQNLSILIYRNGGSAAGNDRDASVERDCFQTNVPRERDRDIS